MLVNWRIPKGWRHLLIGLGIALIVEVTPFFNLMGWVLDAIVHEGGHTVFAWFVGCPSLPAISLRAEACTVATNQVPILSLAIFAGLAYLAWQNFGKPNWRVLSIIVLVAYPLLAGFELVRNVGIHLAGHLGELAIGGAFLWRARTGRTTFNEIERTLYATCGWYLVIDNAWLDWGIAFIPRSRAEYLGGGSFGLTNDYVRVVEEVRGISLQGVALVMLAVSFVVPVIAIWLGGRLIRIKKAEIAQRRMTPPAPPSRTRTRPPARRRPGPLSK